MMRLPKRDIIATGAVAVAVASYLLWLVDAALPGMTGTRATGLVILALGFLASATAVVPSCDQLMHGNKLYLAVTSMLGLVALIAGVLMLWSASSAPLAVLMAALIALWVISTAHHVVLAKTDWSASHDEVVPQAGAGHRAGLR